ncbi:MAG TPA: hypothetical protein VK607_15405, partial [Kofleriaceae bacterium]|nr:hypothetical protein [Kofleriaceae bacterium]
AALRRGAAAAGFELATDAHGALLFVAAPRGGELAALIDRAEQLARDATAAAAHPDLLVAATVHTADIELGAQRSGERRPAAAAGMLFDLAGWTRTDASGVFVTRAARVALESR